ncbi:MAG TPA: RNA methyltransferase [Gaiellaceae bacterium]|nr:RNA methyltransferase [Gaiellaceae bacterium]
MALADGRVITSPDNERVKDVVRLRKSRERRASGLFIAEGRREVERALAAGLTARDAYVAPELIAGWPHPHTEVSARVLAKMAYRAEPEGVIAVFEQPRRALPGDATLILVAVGIEKPGNLGAMARTADAAGVDALIVADAQADPWNPNAIRASTGAVFTLPIVEATRADIEQLELQKVAAVTDATMRVDEADLTQPTALLIGAEDKGLDEHWREIADVEARIPMSGRSVDSLNASNAAAILLYETLRQRG